METNQNAHCLSTFEALQKFKEHEKQSLNDDRQSLNDGKQSHSLRYEESKKYAEMFHRFSNEQSLQAARELLETTEVDGHHLKEKDVATILDLCPETVEDAIIFAPDLKNLDERDVEDIIRHISRLADQ